MSEEQLSPQIDSPPGTADAADAAPAADPVSSGPIATAAAKATAYYAAADAPAPTVSTETDPVVAAAKATEATPLPPARFSALWCVKCGQRVPLALPNSGLFERCRRCGAELMAESYPALLQAGPRGETAKAVLMDDQASCYNHPHKKAVVPCDDCGRFLCSLCQTQLGGKQLCPACYEAAMGQATAGASGHNSIFKYDSLALLFAVLPTIITPVISVFLVLFYWRRPRSILPKGRWKAIAALVLALGQIAFWCLSFYSKFTRM